jgi:hypothetical protein
VTGQVPTVSTDPSGNGLVLLPDQGADNLVQVVFGEGSGHAMLRSCVYPSFDAKMFDDQGGWTWTNAAANVQVVLAGLNRSDVDFFYKQYNNYIDSYGDRQWTPDSIGTDKELGFIQIKATGETLVLPEGDFIPPPQYADDAYYPNLSIEFADGTSVTGAALDQLFDQQGASETDYWYTEGGGNWDS